MSQLFAHALARTEDKEGPNQPNSTTPSQVNGWRGGVRLACLEKVLKKEFPLSLVSAQGKNGIREDPAKLYSPIPLTPPLNEQQKNSMKMSVLSGTQCTVQYI